jgi:protein-tyrosine phosphatase
MEFLGAPWPKYIAAATDKNIKIYRLPMVEGSCPNTIEDVKNAIDVVNDEIVQGNNVLVHCRGGVGRAGLFACCWLLENLLCRTAERAISVVREQRSPKAIETLRQADYIIRYSKSVKQRYGLQYSDTMKRPKSMEADHRYTTPSINTIAQLEYDIMTA